MADNYLERKMEDYRAGKSSGSKSPASPGSLRKRLKGKRVFVTGGARGIGRAVVEEFMREGARVAFCDIDSEPGRKVAEQAGARFYPCDVADAEAFDRIVSDVISYFGDLDIIVNNVGEARFCPLEELTVEDFDHTLAVNLRPVFISAKCLALSRKDNPNESGGRIINICSTRAFQSEEGTEAYSASKGGIFALTHALMMSLAPYGVTVNAISPGWIETSPDATHSESDRKQHPSGRVGVPADVARLCIFLTLPESDFINGENIRVDGGMTRKMIYEP